MTEEAQFWNEEAEAPSDWREYQDALVKRAVQYASECSREVRHRLADAGLNPEAVSGIGDLRNIRVLAKDDLPELQVTDPPFGGLLAVDVGELRRIYRSPGPINDPEGRTPDFWRMAPALWAAGFRPGDIVLNTLSYHLTPGGHMLDAGLREVGCVVLPGGVGSSSTQASFSASVGATGYVGTPQFLLTLCEKIEREEIPISFQKALVTGAPLPQSLRRNLQGAYGIDVFQVYGTADAGALGFECEAKRGWHIAPGVAIEIIEPGMGEPVGPGESGEVVVTSSNEIYPLVRFGTGDLSSMVMDDCTCGRTTPRLKGFLGRVGEGVKVRGMFVHPRQLAAVLDTEPSVHRYQGVVTSEGHRDVLTVMVESDEIEVPALAALIEEATNLRVAVTSVPSGTIEEGAKLLVDAR